MCLFGVFVFCVMFAVCLVWWFYRGWLLMFLSLGVFVLFVLYVWCLFLSLCWVNLCWGLLWLSLFWWFAL